MGERVLCILGLSADRQNDLFLTLEKTLVFRFRKSLPHKELGTRVNHPTSSNPVSSSYTDLLVPSPKLAENFSAILSSCSLEEIPKLPSTSASNCSNVT